jgi:hypothetical protein
MRTKLALDTLAEDRAKKLAAFETAIAATKRWEKRRAMVNEILGYEAYKDGESARVAYAKLKKTQAKSVTTDDRYKKKA